MKSRIHGVEDILLGFEPKDAGSIPAGSARFLIKNVLLEKQAWTDPAYISHENRYIFISTLLIRRGGAPSGAAAFIIFRVKGVSTPISNSWSDQFNMENHDKKWSPPIAASPGLTILTNPHLPYRWADWASRSSWSVIVSPHDFKRPSFRNRILILKIQSRSRSRSKTVPEKSVTDFHFKIDQRFWS